MGSYIDEFKDDHKRKSEIVVTIDGTSGAGKGTLARSVAEALNISHYGAGDFFRQIAADRNMTVGELSEKADRETDIEVDRRTLQKGLEENCVIDGRLPSWVMGDYSDLRIFLTADLKERAKRISMRENTDKDEQIELTRKRDEDNRERYQRYYGINTKNIEHYDVVVDNTDMSVKEQNDTVKEILEKRFPDRFEK